ncbi:MAG: M20/M25/M40 family metallo-hydrolase [Anaerolineae bacterium]|jgi:acetylornithine deacetylase/succinyl-diaminopimelate desuccinylase-like protein
MEGFGEYVDTNRDRFLAELCEACAQPSIAAQGIGLEETASIVEQRLASLGAHVQRFEIDGSPPLLYAELGSGEKTMLVYNHYDVQPPDPLDEWESSPFEPEVRDGRLYARGVADDKGDLFCRLQAIEAYQATVGPVPLRIKFVIEGEEEVGSPHLDTFAEAHPQLLEADGCLWETGNKDAARRTVLTLGVKGICYVELSAKTAARDLHSAWGGIIPNAAWRLVWALNTLKDEADHILVDGLMDHVQAPTEDELAQLASLPFDEDQERESLGFPRYVRDLTGVDLLVKHFYEPTCTICGLRSGYIEEGVKTVLPNQAMAKVDFRLVPDLTPDLVVELLREHLDRQGFEDISITAKGGLMPARSPLDAPFVQACVAACEATYGEEPIIYPTSPGSGPLYTLSRETPAVMAGVAHADSRLHAPNENIYLQDYFEGIRFIGELIHRFAA